MRNIEKTIAEGTRIVEMNPGRTSINYLDFKRMEEIGEDSKVGAMYNAFLVGLALGNRIGRSQAANK